jgi:NADH/NAD ratio-sensing transcriptional regulator Rex
MGVPYRLFWNFTCKGLTVPAHVIVQKQDLSLGFAAFRLKMANDAPRSEG